MTRIGPPSAGRPPKYLDRALTPREAKALQRARKAGKVPVLDPFAGLRAAYDNLVNCTSGFVAAEDALVAQVAALLGVKHNGS